MGGEMKICLIRTGEIKSRQRIRIDAFCEFRGASVYTLTVDGNLRERRFGKALGKGISELRKYGVTLFGAPYRKPQRGREQLNN